MHFLPDFYFLKGAIAYLSCTSHSVAGAASSWPGPQFLSSSTNVTRCCARDNHTGERLCICSYLRGPYPCDNCLHCRHFATLIFLLPREHFHHLPLSPPLRTPNHLLLLLLMSTTFTQNFSLESILGALFMSVCAHVRGLSRVPVPLMNLAAVMITFLPHRHLWNNLCYG